MRLTRLMILSLAALAGGASMPATAQLAVVPMANVPENGFITLSQRSFGSSTLLPVCRGARLARPRIYITRKPESRYCLLEWIQAAYFSGESREHPKTFFSTNRSSRLNGWCEAKRSPRDFRLLRMRICSRSSSIMVA